MGGHGSQWMLRPGELVKVDLSGSDASTGYYVAMDAIVRENSRLYLFVVEGADDSATVKRMEIKVPQSDVSATTSSLRQIESINGESLEGIRFVTRGAHYLRDGEAVKVVSGAEDSQ